MNTFPTARWGEAAAAAHLGAAGWTVRNRNYRLGHREIDLIAQRGRTIAFVEVKTRRCRSFGPAVAAVGAAQRRSITRVASAWIAQHGENGMQYRFDTIAVERSAGGGLRLQHLPDAWGI